MVAKDETPLLNAWQLVCCALAVPVVYYFEQYFYEAIVLIISAAGYVLTLPMHVPASDILPGLDPHDPILFTLLVKLPLMLVIALACIVFALAVIAVGLVLLVPWGLAYWLATHPGPPRYLLDLILVWYVGLFLYGVLFPLVWRLTEPLIAHTLGEMAFQRARARVYGTRPRYAQPLYLVIALVGLIAGASRALVPATGPVAAAYHQVADPVFRPTPPAWPKVFHVAPGKVVATGIPIPGGEELGFHSTAQVVVHFGSVAATRIAPSSTSQHAGPCLVPAFSTDRCSVQWTGTPERADLVLAAGPAAATVTVYGPAQRTTRRWLAPAESYTPSTIWFDKEDVLLHCTGPGVSYRVRSAQGFSSWQSLNPSRSCSTDPNHLKPSDYTPKAGHVELRAGPAATWVQTIGVERATRHVWFQDGPDTKIPIRPGDRFRVAANGSALKIDGTGTVPAHKTIDITASRRGTIHIRPVNPWYNFAQVTILERGPQWK
jgi:hypothetical protein